MSWFMHLSLLFTAGCIGGLATALVIWFFGNKGITELFAVNLVPKMNTSFLYSKIIWGGLWGLVFIIVAKPDLFFYKAALLSLAPTVVQLFYVFPKQDQGPAGLKLGTLTPLMVLFFNLVWAITTATWIYFSNSV